MSYVHCLMFSRSFVAMLLWMTGGGCNILLAPFVRGIMDVVLVSKPVAGFLEVFAEDLHGEGDGAAMSSTNEALEGVATYMEAEAGVLVVVERAEGFVLLDL